MSEPAAAVVTPPLVAIVGRPNVGKSTLFNRLCGGHHAIVEDEPGVTRDRRYGEADWAGRRFRVVDTGGLDESAAQQSSIARGVRTQAIRAIDEAALLLFVVDAQEGLTTGDREVFVGLRRTGKPLLFVANKVDGSRHEVLAAEAYELGAEQVFAISAAHGRNLAELCDGILAALPDAPPLVEESTARPLRIALVGRPNAGKSSLVNRLVGAERVIVDPTPGTTRDPVDTPFVLRDHPAVLIDTAGIRKRARVELAMEKIAVTMAEKAIGRCDVAVLVIDGAGGVAEQEAKIAGLCQEAGRALVIAFNKRDLFPARDEKQRLEELERKLQFVPWAKVVFCSAHSGRGMESLLDAVLAVHASHNRRVATGELNRFFERLLVDHPPPVFRGHQVKLYYITQVAVRPPTFVLSVNQPDGVHFSYRRYITNRLREEFGFVGTPLRLICRGRKK